MDLPFSSDQFLANMATYNAAIEPAQAIAWLTGAVLTACLFRPRSWTPRLVFALLAAFWAINGALYHILHFARINPAAYGFGALFLLQAGLFVARALRPSGLTFCLSSAPAGLAAAAMIAYGLIVYPLLGLLAGPGYPATPLFGVSPCPTVIFTFGMLMLVRPRAPIGLFAIPLLWSIIGGSAALLLAMPADWGLVAAAAGWLLFGRPWRREVA